MQEMQVQSPGQEDPLEKDMTTHSSILAWEIPWAIYSLQGQKELDTAEATEHTYTNSYYCSCKSPIVLLAEHGNQFQD